MKPNFDICVIARNEEKTLPRFFDSLKDFLDRGGECHLTDTGSTDKTVEIAKSFGAIVHEAGDKFKRIITEQEAEEINKAFVVEGEANILKAGESLFDFASARNYAASFAKNDFVFFHDADECYTRLDIDKINEIIADDNLNNLEYEFVFSHDSFGSPTIQFVQSKAYRKDRLFWSGIVHEVLQPIQKK